MIPAFLAFLAATLAFGAYLGTTWARAGQQLTSHLADFHREMDVCDEAVSAETACDWGGTL